MKNLKQIGLFLALFISGSSFSQGVICDDFTEAPWPAVPTSYLAGELVGYSQDGTQPITVGPGSDCSFSDLAWEPGIYVWNYLNFAFDGDNQKATFNIYGIEEQYGEMGFTVNGSPLHYMNETFPMTIDGVTIELDASAEDVADWDNAYLIFTGELDEVDIYGFESGITTLCVESLFDESDCDDFKALPSITYGGDELIGYSQDGTQPITTGAGAYVPVNISDPGIYGVGPVNFAFDGSNQVAQFEIYGWIEQYGEMGFSVNGSDIHYMDETFPMTVDGITIDLDDSAEDFGSWDNAYLIFTGMINEVDIILFESGVQTLCVEPAFTDGGCDDFRDPLAYPEATYSGEDLEGEIIGYTQDGTQTITLGEHSDTWIHCSISTFGIFTGGSTIDFAFDGTAKSARFHLGESSMGPGTGRSFSVNGSTYTSLHGDYPMIIDGVTVDMDTTTVPDLSVYYYDVYLTFSGNLDLVSIRAEDFHESNIIELCVEPLFEEGECDDFTDMVLYPIESFAVDADMIGDEIGTTQGGTQSITIAGTGDGWCNINSGFDPGIYGGVELDFGFDGTSQTARFLMYGWLGGPTEQSFAVNGSAYFDYDNTFPMDIDGVTVELDDSPTGDGFDFFYLTFTGDLDVVTHKLFESGILELCVEPFLDTDVECDDFTGEPWPMDAIFEAGEVIGHTQDDAYPVTVGDEGTVYVNTDPVYFPGLFINNAPLIFDFDGSDQFVQFEIYEWFGAGSEGFELNGEPLTIFDDTYPMTIDGVVVDLELTGVSVGTAELAYLTFEGEIDEIVMVGGELGITELCYASDSTIIDDSGLNDYNTDLISVYPNPADQFVTVNSNELIQNIRIYTIAGGLVFEKTDINKNQITLQTGEFEQGLYLVEMFLSDGTRAIEKVILE